MVNVTAVVPVRVLRWVYTRATDSCTCELTLDAHALVYELRTSIGTPSSPRIERFHAVGRAFQRQSTWESALIDDGWTLATFESEELCGGPANVAANAALGRLDGRHLLQ